MARVIQQIAIDTNDAADATGRWVAGLREGVDLLRDGASLSSQAFTQSGGSGGGGGGGGGSFADPSRGLGGTPFLGDLAANRLIAEGSRTNQLLEEVVRNTGPGGGGGGVGGENEGAAGALLLGF